MSDISVFLGKRIRELRTRQHMSQEDLSFRAGISAAHLGQIERATKNPTVDTVARIAEALNVPITSLFEEYHPASRERNSTMEKIVSCLEGMDENEQADLLRVIRIFRSYLPRKK